MEEKASLVTHKYCRREKGKWLDVEHIAKIFRGRYFFYCPSQEQWFVGTTDNVYQTSEQEELEQKILGAS